MLNDETKRKLRELNISEIIDAIEFQNQDPVTVTLPSMSGFSEWWITYIRKSTTVRSRD